jgi:hypothetical protein
VLQFHTNYQVSMVLEAISGIINVDDFANFLHPLSHQSMGSMSLHQVMLKYLKMSKGHLLIAEVHQAGPQLKMTIIAPHTLEDKQLIAIMNKNVAAFLWHMLLEKGLPKDFIQTLLKKAYNPALFAVIPSCEWDAT